MCAGTTVYAPLREAGAGPGTHVVVVGLGGLGVMAIKIAKALGCTVTAISRGAGKKPLAMRSGADSFLSSADAESMAAAAGTVDLVLNMIPSAHDTGVYTSLLSVEGRQVHIGLHASAITAGSVNFLLPGRTREKLTFIGGISTTQEVMDLAARAGIKTEIEVKPAADINRVFEALSGDNASGVRFVIDVANTLSSTLTTAPPTSLVPHPPAGELLKDVASGIAARLEELVDKPAKTTMPSTPPSRARATPAVEEEAPRSIGKRLFSSLFFEI